jgi:hypothetical protein
MGLLAALLSVITGLYTACHRSSAFMYDLGLLCAPEQFILCSTALTFSQF